MERKLFIKVLAYFVFIFVACHNAFSQAQNVGIGTTTPDNSAILELYSTSHGFLVPRLTTIQRNAISSPATGLLIYNLDNQRFEYYNGSQWIGVVSSVATVPFNLISSGTNTTATMTVGTGATIVLGGGIIEANVFKGTGSTTDAVDLNSAEVAGVLPVTKGGTGVSTIPAPGQVLIGNGTDFTLNTLTPGAGITITNGAGTITIDLSNTGVTAGTYGDGTHIAQVTVDSKGRVTSATNIAISFPSETDPVYNSEKSTIVYDGDAAGGDLSGTYPNPTVAKLQGYAVSSAAPSVGQVLKWNGTSWVPSTDDNTTYVAGDALNLTGNTFNVMYDDVTIGRNGSNQLYLKDNSVTSVKIQDGTIVDADISSTAGIAVTKLAGGGANQFLVNNGANTWAGLNLSSNFTGNAVGTALDLSNTGVTAGTYGDGTHIAQVTVDSKGRVTSATNIAISFPSETDPVYNSEKSTIVYDGDAAGGDLSGTYPNPTVARLQGYAVSSAAPSSGQVLKWNGTSWTPSTLETLPTGSTGQTLRYNGGWEASNLVYNDVTNNRVGLNFTSPAVLLHQDQGTGNPTYHKFTAGSTTGTGSSDGFDIGIASDGTAQIKQNENLPLIFYTNGTERMRILDNGKVGVGTTTVIDSVLLQTNGDVYIDGDLIVTGNIDPKVIYLQPLTSTPSVISKGAIFYDNNADALRVYNGSSWSSLITQNNLQTEVASVAWKTTGNSGLSESTNFIGTTDNVGLKIKTNNADRVIVTSTGNVGIGTTSPNSTLSVEGSISGKVTVVTSGVTLDESYYTVLANSSSNMTITLPNPSSSNVGRTYIIKNINTGVLTISGSIEGSSQIVLRQRESVELISNGSTWVVTSSFQPVPPIGSIIAWHKDFANTPSLPYGWVECNGQTLNDPASPYHNQVIPNLNGDQNGANSPGLNEKAGMFLRGGTTSGTGQYDAFQGHRHSIDTDGALKSEWEYNSRRDTDSGNYGPYANITVGDPISDGTNGTPRTANETRPKNMSVVWIMRVK